MSAVPIDGYCILWLRTDRGINIKGDAWKIVPNISSKDISVGDVVLLSGPGYGKGHGAEITAFEGGYIHIIENWKGKVRTRKIALDNPAIRGFYHAYTSGEEIEKLKSMQRLIEELKAKLTLLEAKKTV